MAVVMRQKKPLLKMVMKVMMLLKMVMQKVIDSQFDFYLYSTITTTIVMSLYPL